MIVGGDVVDGELADGCGPLGVEQHQQAGDPIFGFACVVVQKPAGLVPSCFGVDGLFPLLVCLRDATTLHVSGGNEYLDILWDALEGVAHLAETADDRGVNRHQHIEHFPGDEHRSPDSIPLVIVADWPQKPIPMSR